jgi:hypothetical protein
MHCTDSRRTMRIRVSRGTHVLAMAIDPSSMKRSVRGKGANTRYGEVSGRIAVKWPRLHVGDSLRALGHAPRPFMRRSRGVSGGASLLYPMWGRRVATGGANVGVDVQRSLMHPPFGISSTVQHKSVADRRASSSNPARCAGLR